MSSIVEAWERFWFSRGVPACLGLFRILFAWALYHEVRTTRAKSLFAIEGGFHLPYLELVPRMPELIYHLVHDLQYPLIWLVALGLCVRPACACLLVLQGWVFFGDQLNFRNHPYFFMLVILLLMLSPAGEAFSLRALARARRSRRPIREAMLGPECPLTWQRLIQVQVGVVYFFAALHKVTPSYLRGEYLSDRLGADLLSGSSGAHLEWLIDAQARADVESWVRVPANMAIPSMLAVLIELSLPFALWFRRTRWIAMGAGVAFHLAIAWTMEIRVFSIAMIASYVLFIPPQIVERLWRRLARLPQPRCC